MTLVYKGKIIQGKPQEILDFLTLVEKDEKLFQEQEKEALKREKES